MESKILRRKLDTVIILSEMKIERQITLYFSITTLIISGVGFTLIYFLFSANREEAFQLRQKQKVFITLDLIAKVKRADVELLDDVDMLTIHDLYDEKLLLFNSSKQLIYSSLDDVPIPLSNDILSNLNSNNKWVEAKEGRYDIIGTYIEEGGKTFYGISKAYDKYGYAKLHFLGYVLALTFLCIVVIVIIISSFLASKITRPLAAVTQQIVDYNFENNCAPIRTSFPQDEVALLIRQFNKLMNRLNIVFSFQKHAVHHISHELKTPISVLVSNFEKMENENDLSKVRAFIKSQKEGTKNLGDIINVLLEIAKTESGNVLKQDLIRIDELIFDIADELKILYEDFFFLVNYSTPVTNEDELKLFGNARLIKSALVNLMQNAILYSYERKSNIIIITGFDFIKIVIDNIGAPISEAESQLIFQHFFRGSNVKGKQGFGLGLVLVNRIVTLHGGSISYCSKGDLNSFILTLPLR